MGEIAEQVAHDIKSPLVFLEVVSNNIKSLSEKEKLMLKNAVNRIKDIILDLSSKPIKKQVNGKKSSVELLFPIIDSIISEKRMRNVCKASKQKKKFCVNFKVEGNRAIFAQIIPEDFKRVLSNIINNSIEAVKTNVGIINVHLSEFNDKVVLSIKDNGCGIKNEHIAKVLERGGTIRKQGGSGLGLSYSKTCVEQLGGELSLNSRVGVGTSVEIKLPSAEKPEWFLSKLNIYRRTKIVILDDDESVHQAWNKLFCGFNKADGLGLIHCQTLLEFVEACLITNNDFRLFLVDYEISDKNKNGLDLIREQDIERESVLVTSSYDNISLRKACKNIGVKILPKVYVPYVPITLIENKNKITHDCDLILIDDDDNLRAAWEIKASSANRKIDTYDSFSAFMEYINLYKTDIPIYIDSDLGNGDSGELLAKTIFELGFVNLYLTTGYSGKLKNKYPWIKEVIGKTPPF